MKKQILISGGTGFIGQSLVDEWLAMGHSITVISRRPQWVLQRWNHKVSAMADIEKLDQKFDWLINLAGEGIADKRWSASRKQQLRASRIDVTLALAQWAKARQQSFELVLSGSAIGYYGSFDNDQHQGKAFSESAASGKDFSAQLCSDWEKASDAFKECSQRLLLLRTGVVLGKNGGMLQRLWLPFKLGLGGVIGSGQQVLSWIHLRDYCRAIHFLCSSDLDGCINMASPNAVTNREFTKVLGYVLNRPTLLPMPTFAARFVFGEMGDLLLKGQRVEPAKLSSHGFEFEFAGLEQALGNIHQNWS